MPNRHFMISLSMVNNENAQAETCYECLDDQAAQREGADCFIPQNSFRQFPAIDALFVDAQDNCIYYTEPFRKHQDILRNFPLH